MVPAPGLSKKSDFFDSPAKIADGKPRFLRELCVFCCKNSIKRKINGQKRRGPAPSKRSTAMEKLVKRVFLQPHYVVRVKIPCFFRELLPNPLD